VIVIHLAGAEEFAAATGKEGKTSAREKMIAEIT
jgi:hypothetical protein